MTIEQRDIAYRKKFLRYTGKAHTVLEWSDEKYALLRHVLARRQTFFEDIRALTRYLVFDSWPHLMDFMIRGLELESRLDSKPTPKFGPKLDTS